MAVVAGKHDRAADRPAEFVADEWRNAAAVQFDVIEIITGIDDALRKNSNSCHESNWFPSV